MYKYCERLYKKAKNEHQQWQGLLEKAYRYSLPRKNTYVQRTEGQNLNNQVYNSTAIESVQSFANNIQNVIMPPFKVWAKLQPHEDISDENKEQIEGQLEKINDIIFKKLTQSNLSEKANEAFQELAIGTGVLFINESPENSSFYFDTASISDIVLGQNGRSELVNFWREWKLTAQDIVDKWPKIKLNDMLSKQLERNEVKENCIIEGFVEDPQIKGKKNLYYIKLKDKDAPFHTEFLDSSPLIAFRFSKTSYETLGRGPVLRVLDTIKVLNKYEEFDLKSAHMAAYPPYMVSSNGIINPYLTRIDPASLIYVNQNGGPGNWPIKQLEYTGNMQLALEKQRMYEQQIRKALFANPIPASVNDPTKTATEISILQQEWMRENAVSFGRLITELLNPLIKKCIDILYKQGAITDLTINGEKFSLKRLDIRYESPIAEIQRQQEIQKAQEYIQSVVGVYGQAGVLAINKDYYKYIAEKIGVSQDVVNQEFGKQVKAIQDSIQKGLDQAEQQQPGPATAPVDNQQNALQAIQAIQQQNKPENQ